MFTYISVVNYIMIASAVLQRQNQYAVKKGGYYFTMPYWISALLSPFIGAFVNKYGKRMTVSLIGSVTLVLAHSLLFFIPIC